MANDPGQTFRDSSFDNEEETLNISRPAPLPRPRRFSDYSKQQKFLMLLFGVFFVLIIVIFSYRFRAQIQVPIPGADQLANMPAITNTAVVDNSDEALKKRDTDGDGFSDYDELYVYNTSPYLEDTDGDGLSDNVEIQNGTDPLCPEGKSCLGTTTTQPSGPGTGTTPKTEPTPAQLRQLLTQSGQFTAEQLKDITDDELMQYYRESLAENPEAATTPSATTNSTPVLKNPDQYTPAEIRQFLLDSGIDTGTVSSLDDATLKKLFLDAWAAANASQAVK